MKKLFYLVIFTILLNAGNGVAPTASFIDASEIPDNMFYKETMTKTYKRKQCYRAYTRLKKEMKTLAKAYCVSNGWSNRLQNKYFIKLSCTKVKRKHHKTKITVKATFGAMCTNKR